MTDLRDNDLRITDTTMMGCVELCSAIDLTINHSRDGDIYDKTFFDRTLSSIRLRDENIWRTEMRKLKT